MPKVSIAGASNAAAELLAEIAAAEAAAAAPAVQDEAPAEAALADEPAAADEPGPSPGGDLPAAAAGPEDYAARTILDLRALARERGLPVAGAKADLVARLEEDDS